MIKWEEKTENGIGDILGKWSAGGASWWWYISVCFMLYLFRSFYFFTVSKTVKVPVVRMHPIASGAFGRLLTVACWVSRCLKTGVSLKPLAFQSLTC